MSLTLSLALRGGPSKVCGNKKKGRRSHIAERQTNPGGIATETIYRRTPLLRLRSFISVVFFLSICDEFNGRLTARARR